MLHNWHLASIRFFRRNWRKRAEEEEKIIETYKVIFVMIDLC